MRLGRLLLATSVIGLLNMSAGARAESFFSECKGNQRGKSGGIGVEVTYRFKSAADGTYTGSAEYWNTSNNRTFEGVLKDIVITPDKVNFLVTYTGGVANGDTAKIALERTGNALRGSGENKTRGATFDINLTCQ